MTASKEELLVELKDIVNEVKKSNGSGELVQDLSPEDSLQEDLGLDSLDLAEMTVRIENNFGVDVFEDQVVEEIHEIVEIITAE